MLLFQNFDFFYQVIVLLSIWMPHLTIYLCIYTCNYISSYLNVYLSIYITIYLSKGQQCQYRRSCRIMQNHFNKGKKLRISNATIFFLSKTHLLIWKFIKLKLFVLLYDHGHKLTRNKLSLLFSPSDKKEEERKYSTLRGIFFPTLFRLDYNDFPNSFKL